MSYSLNLTNTTDADPISASIYFNYIFVPVVLALGTIGNSLTVRIMLSRDFQRMSVSRLLLILALSDTVVILLLPFNVDVINALLGADIRALSNAGCKIYFWSYRYFRLLSAWMLVLVACERFVAVWIPTKAKLVNTVPNCFMAVSVIGVTLIAYTGYWSSLTDHLISGECLFNVSPAGHEQAAHWITIFGTLISIVVPSAMLITLNSLIAYKLISIKRKKARLVGSALANVSSSTCSAVNPTSSSNRSKQERKTNMMLLCVTMAFVVLASPMGLLQVTSFLKSEPLFSTDHQTLVLVRDMAQKLEQLNHSISFLLYVWSSKRFRDRLVEIFDRKSTASTSDTGSRTPTS